MKSRTGGVYIAAPPLVSVEGGYLASNHTRILRVPRTRASSIFGPSAGEGTGVPTRNPVLEG